jgi:phosphate uptake regulator/aminoglycoside phosphotransferase (APT) family kinase protein
MALPLGIRNNLTFLIAEVQSQLKTLDSCLAKGVARYGGTLLERSGYVYNLKMRLHDDCMMAAAKQRELEVNVAQSLSQLANELERITELSKQCVNQLFEAKKVDRVHVSTLRPMLKIVAKAVNKSSAALFDSDTEVAIKLGNAEKKLSKAFKTIYATLSKKSALAKDQHALMALLFVARTIEQMGDCIRVMGESILSIVLGQPTDIHRFKSLQSSLSALEQQTDATRLKLESVAETRSGSNISQLSISGQSSKQAIFKDGKKRKLKEEMDGVARWHDIFPGVAPEILTYSQEGDSAALLIEYLQGVTFEHLLLHGDQQANALGMRHLTDVLMLVWQKTFKPAPSHAGFMQQLRKRLKEIFEIHPEFFQGNERIGNVELMPFEALLDRAESIEQEIKAPFSVYIHGDFNIDNIIFDSERSKINFIDLHRSKYQDYLQDVSVFIVSNWRLQVFDRAVRDNINQQSLALYSFSKAFAEAQNDPLFEIRLALGLARSLATSTRFILDKSMAHSMFMRARYLMEQVVRISPDKRSHYRLPLKELINVTS